MFRFSRIQPLPIGLDIGYTSVRLLQLGIDGDGLCVVEAAREPMPSDTPAIDVASRCAVAVEIARELIRRNDFAGRQVIACLPRECVHMKNLRLPAMPPNELDGAMAFEARNLFPFDVDQATVRWLPAGEVRQGGDVRQELIVLAAKNAEVELFVEQLHKAGLVPMSIDFEPCALYRTVERFLRRREDEQEVYVLADVGARRTTVVIGRGHDINFIKSIEIGGQHLREAVARKLDIGTDEAAALRRRLADAGAASDPTDTGAQSPDSVRQAVYDSTRDLAEELARELALCLRYHSVTFRGQRPAKVRLTGGEATDPQLQKVLAAALPIPVEVGRNIQNVDLTRLRPAMRQGALSVWAVAMGLSLKGTQRYFAGTVGRPRGARMPDDNSGSDGGLAIEDAAAGANGARGGGATTTAMAARSLFERLGFRSAPEVTGA
jgi:type IV pilus assembly protein PilM